MVGSVTQLPKRPSPPWRGRSIDQPASPPRPRTIPTRVEEARDRLPQRADASIHPDRHPPPALLRCGHELIPSRRPLVRIVP
jgi:hypothetical protein